MKLTINSRKLNRKITFSRPGSYYIYVDINGMSGTLGLQICHGGCLMGDTISYTGNYYAAFDRICRIWYKLYLKNLGDIIV